MASDLRGTGSSDPSGDRRYETGESPPTVPAGESRWGLALVQMEARTLDVRGSVTEN